MNISKYITINGLIHACKPAGAVLIFICGFLAYDYQQHVNALSGAMPVHQVRLPAGFFSELPSEKAILLKDWTDHVASRLEETHQVASKQSFIDQYAEIPYLAYLTFFGGLLILTGECVQAHRDSTTTAPSVNSAV